MSTPTEKEKKIVVVGAGMVGLGIALSLAKSSYDGIIEVMERRPNKVDRRGSAYSLAPNGQKAMQYISPSVLEHCHKVGIYMSMNGGLLLPWFAVRDQLYKECCEMPNVRIQAGYQVSKIEQTDSNVMIHINDSDEVILCDALIAADGVRSTVRRCLELVPAEFMGSTVWRGIIDTNKAGSKLFDIHETKFPKEHPIIPMRIGKKIQVFLFSFHAQNPGTLAWLMEAPSKEQLDASKITPLQYLQQAEEWATTPDETKETIETVFGEANPKDFEWNSPFCTTPLPSWGGKGRVTLIGDAAHTIYPTSGLGGSMGFEDVVVLTRMLEKHSFEFEAAFRDFEETRLPRVAFISEEQIDRSRVFREAPKRSDVPAWSKEYKEWVYNGPDSPSTPIPKVYD
uniref:FAD-binding domain-containing protein n=1 Tax=Cyclophora tenuis TaxID=216820 RepID=A0A7S1CVT0_CYCTE|mmetsp:Transcript_11313/g.19213  ORF Transcript_11313/g.19213 Transcript_11313/m.19213 type:complete len:397 (+) Transcript_11313:52-1242(+)